MKSIILTLCACLAVVTLPAWGQAPSAKINPNTHGVAGYLDPTTGTFTTRLQNSKSEAPTSPPPPSQGTFVVGLTINLVNTFPSGETFNCEADVDTFDSGSGLDFHDSMAVAGNRSGNTVTCQMTIPYYWPLMTPSDDSVTVSFAVEALGPSGTVPERISEHGIVNDLPIPAQFRTTTFNQGDVL